MAKHYEVIVPSDVALVEQKLRSGARKLTVLERLGLATVFPVFRRNWTKNDRRDLRAILSKSYEETGAVDAERQQLLEIVQTRQKQVHRMMVTRAAGLIGAVLVPAGTWYSFRHYDHKGQAVPLPFALYGGNLVGRALAGWLTGRWSAPLREVSLGNLPAHRFLGSEESDDVN
eukprot:Blabericola_migrator_1__3428@NODE_2009_length_3428_cov_249_755727_g1275_i0_p2_GENE_NODE_2009_length_3428_cov_249_755727_g1275_i0NODE_2009_length_3428_cov_249_755727_g1275_i0_p2_ORF_typecomplete_len173_score27_99_NODE_2009_length_3428_cov_249_755727_g1275_i029547